MGILHLVSHLGFMYAFCGRRGSAIAKPILYMKKIRLREIKI